MTSKTHGDGIGDVTVDHQGFPAVKFRDYYDAPCGAEASSTIGDYLDSLSRPGSSCLWLGVDDPAPQIMAKDAAKLGIQTEKTTGWIPYPIPPEVLITTKMHLSREQVRGLIVRLQQWLDTGEFRG